MLSEKELLMLDMLIYLEDSASDTYGTVAELVNDYTAGGEKQLKIEMLSGGFDSEEGLKDFAKLLEDIRYSPDYEALRNLAIVCQNQDADGIRAACFVDPDGNATVAFRGTGGVYDAWYDNLQGANPGKTDMQEAARLYIEETKKHLEEVLHSEQKITVTGHSKGGNLAMFVTIVCPDIVSYCVSYDGQGFSDDFVEKYKDEIAAVKVEGEEKIKSISAHNDFVNILMNNIAGITIYVENTREGADGHYSFPLYEDNNFDKKTGEFLSTMDQDPLMIYLGDYVRTLLTEISETDTARIANVLGVVVSLAMSSRDRNWDKAMEQIGSLGQGREDLEFAIKIMLGMARDNPECRALVEQMVLDLMGLDYSEIGSVREILSLTLNDPFLTNGLAEALSLIVFALPGLLDPKGSGLSSAQSLADVLKAAGILGDLIKYDPMLKAAILETLYELASQGKFGKIAEFLSNPVVIAGVTAIAPIVPITAFLLIELAEDVIGSIAGFLGKVGTTLDFALKFMELLEKAIAAAVDGVTHILEKMQAGFADFMAGLGDLVKRGEAFAVQKAQEFFGGVKDGLNSVMSFLGDVVEGSGKFCSGMVQIASDLAVSTIEGAKVVSNQVIEAIGSAAQSIGGAIVKAFDAVENGIDKIASGIHNVIDTSGAGGPIADIAHIAIDTIQSLEEGALEFLKKAVSFSADGVSSVTKEIQTWSNSFLNGLEDKVKKGTDFVLQQAEAFFSAAKDTLQNITAFMEKVVDKTGAFVVKAAQTLSGLASRAIENVTDAVNNVFDGIETKVQEAGAVIVNAFKDVRGKIDGVATSIIGTLSNAIKGLLQPSQDKNLDVVEEVSLEQAKTGVELINDVVRKLALFIENFESQIQSLAAVAIEKVHSPFLEFKLIIKELTLGSQPIITRSVSDSVSISGGGAAIANVGSGRIAVNFGELRKVRSYAEALLNELKARVSAASRARSAANAATREYDQSYVRSDASATLTACSNLERDDRAVSEELSELMRGIDQVIEGYERLERDLA